MTRSWRNYRFVESGKGATYAASVLGRTSAPYSQVCGVFAGETVIRSRVQMHVTLGVENSSPSTTITSQSILAGAQMVIGLYYNPSSVGIVPPGTLDNPSLDDFWLMTDQLTLTSEHRYEDSTGVLSLGATYTSDAGTYDSKGQRGPAASNNALWLVWWLNANPNPFWTQNTTPLAGIWGWGTRVNVLVEQSPP